MIRPASVFGEGVMLLPVLRGGDDDGTMKNDSVTDRSKSSAASPLSSFSRGLAGSDKKGFLVTSCFPTPLSAYERSFRRGSSSCCEGDCGDDDC